VCGGARRRREHADAAAGKLEQHGTSQRPQAENQGIERFSIGAGRAGCRTASGRIALTSPGKIDDRVSPLCAIPAQARSALAHQLNQFEAIPTFVLHFSAALWTL